MKPELETRNLTVTDRFEVPSGLTKSSSTCLFTAPPRRQPARVFPKLMVLCHFRTYSLSPALQPPLETIKCNQLVFQSFNFIDIARNFGVNSLLTPSPLGCSWVRPWCPGPFLSPHSQLGAVTLPFSFSVPSPPS